MVREKNQKSLSSLRFFKGVKSFLSNRGSNNNNSNNSNTNNGDLQQQDIYAREGVAVTLTTEFNNKSNENGPITLLNPNLTFMPCQPMSSSCFENKAYVHYEPKKAQVALGTNPDAKHTKSLRLTVEQYAWLIQQLQEEQGVFTSLESFFNQQEILSTTTFKSILNNNNSPMLGILSNSVSHSKSIGKRLIRFVQQKRKNLMMMYVPPQLHHHHQYQLQCMFMLPKALLLQAAAYIPMTKPLPPPLAPIHHHVLANQPYQIINNTYQQQLKRYSNYIPLCNHELFAIVVHPQLLHEPSPPSSFINSTPETSKIQCADCSINTGLQTIIQHQQQQAKRSQQQELINSSSISARLLASSSIIKEQGINNGQQSIMFPVSYIQYTTITATNTLLNSQKLQHQQQLQDEAALGKKQQQKVFMASAIQPSSRRVAFDSITRRQKPHAISAFQYIPPDRTMSSSSISSISQYSGIDEEEEEEEEEEQVEYSGDEEDQVEEEVEEAVNDDNNNNLAPQKYGYVAVDAENEEILVVFPGMAMSQNMFENASFAPVPWHEIENVIVSSPTSSLENNKPIPEEDAPPWVLDCALTAWHRCEMKVVTLLMRLCGAMPSHYKVVIIGYSLGGAVAALCASSLRSTKLLMNRPITVCAIHSPRVGNKAFLMSLSNQKVETIRITHYRDLMAHLPPRTSGLCHVGDSTVILPTDTNEEINNSGYVLENMSSNQVEDTLNRTFSFKDYDLTSHSMVWDLNLENDENSTCCT